METTDYCDYKLSLALKAAGFDEPCDSYYDKACAADDEHWHTKREELYNWNGLASECQISAPTLWQAQKWLREKKELFIEVSPNFGMRARATFGITSHDFTLFDSRGHIINDMDRSTYPSYEQALSAGIAAALELIKKGE